MDSITITKEQFREAVKLANENFKNLGNDKTKELDKDGMITLLMGLQNMMFGAMISDVLFGDSKNEA